MILLSTLHYITLSVAQYACFQKSNKWSVSPVTFHGKLETTVKLCGFKCLLYDENEEGDNLTEKAFHLERLNNA